MPPAARSMCLAAFLTLWPDSEVGFRNMDVSSRKFEPPRWYWVVAVWMGIGLFDATQTVFVMRSEGMHHYWGRLFFTDLISWLPWMLATPVVFRLSARFPGAPWKRAAFWSWHLLACLATGVVAAGWLALWEKWLNPYALMPGPDSFTQLWLLKFYAGLLGVAHSLWLDSAGRTHRGCAAPASPCKRRKRRG